MFPILGVILHTIMRNVYKEPLDGLYIAFMLTISTAALYSFNRLSLSLSRAMFTFGWVAMACITGLLIYTLELQRDYLMNMLMFHVGIFTLGLVLGFRSAMRYTLAATAIIVIVGIIYRLLPAYIVVPVFLAFALTLPSRVVDQLIAQSTAELAHINLQLEALVEERRFGQR